MSDRVVMMCDHTSTNGSCFRRGWYYRPGTELAEQLIAERVAYREGEEPPFDPDTLRKMNRTAEREEARLLSHALACAAAEERKQAVLARREEATKHQEEQRQKLIKARAKAARKGVVDGTNSNNGDTTSSLSGNVNTNKNSRRRSKRPLD